jgi:cold shock CspA family protein
VIRWLDEHFLEAAERAIYPDEPPSFEDIKGMYWNEYRRWQTGTHRPLFESDPALFNIEFGKHVEKRREERPHEYIVNLLHRIVHSHRKVPCLVFDNADHFSIEFQERVFQYAHSLYTEVLCLVLIPITDKTSWQLSRQGALQSFFTESFFLPTPAPELVLRKRVDYIEERLDQIGADEKGRGYFFGRGIELSIDNLRGFTSTIQTVFVRSGSAARWIGSLANADIRRCLQLTREIVTSPHIKVPELLVAFLTHSAMYVNDEDTKLAIVRGRYDVYPTGQSSFVQNVYALTTEVASSPLLGVRILWFLNDTSYLRPDGESRYVEVDRVVEYFAAMNLDPRSVRGWLEAMLKFGLVLSYDPTAAGIERASRVEISPAGELHLEWAIKDWVYVEAMAEVTPLVDRESYEQIRDALGQALPFARRKAIRLFLNYLVSEDAKFVMVPGHGAYSGQRQVIEEFTKQVRLLDNAAVSPSTGRFGRPHGRVSAWNQEKGFGFVSPVGGGADVFVHFRDVVNHDDDNLPIGTWVEYDVVESERGPKAKSVSVVELASRRPVGGVNARPGRGQSEAAAQSE